MTNNEFNTRTLTFGQLRSMIEPSNGSKKLPTTKYLRESDTPILIKETISDATITVYATGHILFEMGGRATVTDIERCAEPTFSLIPSTYEEKEGGGVAGCISHLIQINGRSVLLSTVPEDTYTDDSWYHPIFVECSHRLDHNMESREAAHCEFSTNADENERNESLRYNPFSSNVEREAELKKNLYMFLNELPPRQNEVINLLFFDGITQQQVADRLGISQHMVSKHKIRAIETLCQKFNVHR